MNRKGKEKEKEESSENKEGIRYTEMIKEGMARTTYTWKVRAKDNKIMKELSCFVPPHIKVKVGLLLQELFQKDGGDPKEEKYNRKGWDQFLRETEHLGFKHYARRCLYYQEMEENYNVLQNKSETFYGYPKIWRGNIAGVLAFKTPWNGSKLKQYWSQGFLTHLRTSVHAWEEGILPPIIDRVLELLWHNTGYEIWTMEIYSTMPSPATDYPASHLVFFSHKKNFIPPEIPEWHQYFSLSTISWLKYHEVQSAMEFYDRNKYEIIYWYNLMLVFPHNNINEQLWEYYKFTSNGHSRNTFWSKMYCATNIDLQLPKYSLKWVGDLPLYLWGENLNKWEIQQAGQEEENFEASNRGIQNNAAALLTEAPFDTGAALLTEAEMRERIEELNEADGSEISFGERIRRALDIQENEDNEDNDWDMDSIEAHNIDNAMEP